MRFFPTFLIGDHINDYVHDCMVCFMDNLCRHVRRLAIIRILDAVVNTFQVLVDRKLHVNHIIHLLIVGFEVHSFGLPILFEEIFEEILTRVSEEFGVIFLSP